MCKSSKTLDEKFFETLDEHGFDNSNLGYELPSELEALQIATVNYLKEKYEPFAEGAFNFDELRVVSRGISCIGDWTYSIRMGKHIDTVFIRVSPKKRQVEDTLYLWLPKILNMAYERVAKTLEDMLPYKMVLQIRSSGITISVDELKQLLEESLSDTHYLEDTLMVNYSVELYLSTSYGGMNKFSEYVHKELEPMLLEKFDSYNHIFFIGELKPRTVEAMQDKIYVNDELVGSRFKRIPTELLKNSLLYSPDNKYDSIIVLLGEHGEYA